MQGSPPIPGHFLKTPASMTSDLLMNREGLQAVWGSGAWSAPAIPGRALGGPLPAAPPPSSD